MHCPSKEKVKSVARLESRPSTIQIKAHTRNGPTRTGEVGHSGLVKKQFLFHCLTSQDSGTPSMKCKKTRFHAIPPKNNTPSIPFVTHPAKSFSKHAHRKPKPSPQSFPSQFRSRIREYELYNLRNRGREDGRQSEVGIMVGRVVQIPIRVFLQCLRLALYLFHTS